MKNLQFLKAFNSPFKRPKLRWYFGKIQLGVPYFFPRKWVKATPEMAKKRALEEIENIKKYNERNVKYGNPREARTYEEYYQEYLRYNFPVPKKVGFDLVTLGWKTKWTETDYRFEWAPRLSFVFFGYQLAVSLVAPEEPHYWEAWLYYEKQTSKNLTKKERIEKSMKEFPLNYTVHSNGTKEDVNYYERILKPKYLNNK